MATEIISIKERIERVVRLALDGIAELPAAATVYRWDMRGLIHPVTGEVVDSEGGLRAMKHMDIMMLADDETAREGGLGGDDPDDEGQNNYGTTSKTLTIDCGIKLLQPADDKTLTDRLINRWIYRLEKGLMANRAMVEPADVGNEQQLAIDTTVSQTFRGQVEDGQRETFCGVQIVVEYQHLTGDPAAGPGVTRLTEEADDEI